MIKTPDHPTPENGSVSLILRALLRGDKISQTVLVKETGLKKATISIIVNQLKKRKLVVETGKGSASTNGGRRPRYLELSKRSILAFGAAVRGNTLKISLVNLAGETLWTSESTFKRNHTSLWIPVLMSELPKAIKEYLRPDHVFLGLGVSIGGNYNAKTKLFPRFSSQEPGFEEHNVPVQQILQNEFKDLRIITDDFPNAMALGEVWFGCAADLKDFIFLQLENMKATILLDKTLFRGHGDYAGQIGNWRYNNERLREVLIRGNYSTDLLTDLITNLFLSYSPEKIILSKENLPASTIIDIETINQNLVKRFKELPFETFPENAVEIGSFGKEDRARAAATLVFDQYFHSTIFKN